METIEPVNSESQEAMSLVETALRSQRQAWRDIVAAGVGDIQRSLPFTQPKRFLFFGEGSSRYAAQLTALSLWRDRTRVRFPVLAASSTQVGNEILPQKDDWVFAFTHRGGTQTTLEALRASRQAGALTFMVCGKGAQNQDEAHFALETIAQEKVEPHTVSLTSAVCLVSLLLMGQKAAEEWDALCSLGDPDLEWMRSKVGEGPSLIVGEHEGESIAREGALKLMEMARIRPNVFGSEEFFHGPHWSYKPAEESLWYISHPRDPRDRELRPSMQFDIAGNTPFAWIPALVKMQWAALAVALNRGVNPDDPRSGSA